MGESYVDLEWRVVKEGDCIAAFQDLEDAETFSKHVGGELFLVKYEFVEIGSAYATMEE